AHADRLGWGWANFAYRSWLRLSAVDRALSRCVPPWLYYNVSVTGRKAESRARLLDPAIQEGHPQPIGSGEGALHADSEAGGWGGRGGLSDGGGAHRAAR